MTMFVYYKETKLNREERSQRCVYVTIPVLTNGKETMVLLLTCQDPLSACTKLSLLSNP